MAIITVHTQEQFNEALLSAHDEDIIEITSSTLYLPRIHLKNRTLTIQAANHSFYKLAFFCEIIGQGALYFKHCTFQNLNKELMITDAIVNFYHCTFQEGASGLRAKHATISLIQCQLKNITQCCSINAYDHSNINLIDCYISRTTAIENVLISIHDSHIYAMNSKFHVEESNALKLDYYSKATLMNCTWYSSVFFAISLQNYSYLNANKNTFKDNCSGIFIEYSNAEITHTIFDKITQNNMIYCINKSNLKLINTTFRGNKHLTKPTLFISESNFYTHGCNFINIHNTNIIRATQSSHINLIKSNLNAFGQHQALAIENQTTAKIIECDFYGDSSGIHIDYAHAEIENCHFNYINTPYIELYHNSTVYIFNSELIKNIDSEMSLIYSKESTLHITHSLINTLNNNAIKSHQSQLFIHQCNIKNNTQIDVISCFHHSTLALNYSTIEGSIFLNNTNIKMTHTAISNNQELIPLFIENDDTECTITLDECLFTQNHANHLIHLYGNIDFSAHHLYFDKNKADFILTSEHVNLNIDDITKNNFTYNNIKPNINYGKSNHWNNMVIVEPLEIKPYKK